MKKNVDWMKDYKGLIEDKMVGNKYTIEQIASEMSDFDFCQYVDDMGYYNCYTDYDEAIANEHAAYCFKNDDVELCICLEFDIIEQKEESAETIVKVTEVRHLYSSNWF